MNRNFKIIIEYDGTNYHGWQRQPQDNTLQSEIESALARITGQAVLLFASGRTDAGVHALGQVASFSCDTRLDADVFTKALNSLLPDDIVIRHCAEVASDFHARFNAKRKTYQYRILNRPVGTAVNRHFCWHIKKKLNLAQMETACRFLVGTHDFKAFQGQGSDVTDTVRCIFKAGFTTDESQIIFEIQGSGFLRYMVRNIVGSLVDVGLEKITPPEFEQVLLSRNRKNAGITAPAQGLFLVDVLYED